MLYVTPKEASKYYNVAENTLRTWSLQGKIKYTTTKGGHRRYMLPTPENQTNQTNQTKQIKVIYTRVSSKKQSEDLKRQTDYLKNKYPTHTIFSDIASGINFERKGFRTILEGVFKGNISEVVVAHKDRFTRFGYSLFEWIFKQHDSILVCDQESETDKENELSEDLMSIITVFTARYYGRRKYKHTIL
jgi:predicted site-specific integrase-resolvase